MAEDSRRGSEQEKTMFRAWLDNTVVSMIQAGIGYFLYRIFGNLWLTLLAVGMLTLLVRMCGRDEDGPVLAAAGAAALALAAVAGIVAVAMSDLGTVRMVFAIIVVGVPTWVFLYGAAVAIRDRMLSADKNTFAVMIPVVGVVYGPVLLLRRRLAGW